MSLRILTPSMEISDIPGYLLKQLHSFFPHEGKNEAALLSEAVTRTWPRVEHCFAHVNHAAFTRDGDPAFDIFHSDQYAMFLWFVSNEVHAAENHHALAKRLFCLNKALHGLNCLYDVALPPVFLMIHIVGAVIGKATYGNYFVARQGCTVGALRGEYPSLGEGFIMSAGCSVIGRCQIGRGVMLGPSTTLFETDVPDHTLVSGHYLHGLTQKPLSDRALKQHFKIE
jgi:serine O-acetyltransferase